jgi:hypothetical protein
LIFIQAQSTLRVDGTIDASGGNAGGTIAGSDGGIGGGGSGGSVLIRMSYFVGGPTGSILANGGSGASYGAGGAGGLIGFQWLGGTFYDYSRFAGTFSAAGGTVYTNQSLNSLGSPGLLAAIPSCPPGLNTFQCTACPVNTFKSGYGNQPCIPCPSGSVASSGYADSVCICNFFCVIHRLYKKQLTQK